MNKYISRILFSVFILISFCSTATHIVGGELNYRWLGGNNYEISLTVYRDCFNGQAPFDDPIAIGIFDVNDNLVNTIFITFPGSVPLVPTISSPCLIPPSNICYERTTYIQTVNLPPAVGGYQLVYQRCCRNQTIANIVAPLNTGATYNAFIPGPPYVSNGNPVFNNWPPTFICVNAPFTFDHSATDFEGDSLVYELCDPLDGASPGFPMPQPPNPPPYIPVTWQPPYGPANLFGGVPLTINPQTGLLSCTPNAQGQYVYGVCVKEYRNGVYLSSTRRDYQINVVNCPQIVVSSIQSPTLVCGLLTASFTNNSFGAASFFWDFGDLLNINDTSSQQNPVFTYSDTGHYSAMLVAYSGINPACNDTSYGDVYVYPPLHAGFSYQNVPCTNTVMFNDTTHSLSGTLNYWHWDFGDNTISLQQNPTHVYNSGGNYTVTLIVGTNAGCSDTVSAVIPAIIVQPTASFSLSQVPCSGNCIFTNLSSGGNSYSWNFGDNAFSSVLNPTHVYQQPGTFTVTLIATVSNLCADTTSQSVTINSAPTAAFTANTVSCSLSANFINASSNALTFHWNFGDNDTSYIQNPIHVYNAAGNYTVSLVIADAFGCRDSSTQDISVFAFAPADFYFLIDTCTAQLFFRNNSVNALTNIWDFGDNASSFAIAPVHSYSRFGSYSVSLITNPGSACADTATIPLKYDLSFVGNIFIPNAFTPNEDGTNDIFEVVGYYPCDDFTFYIYNRWGELVYKTISGHISWDGTYKGKFVEGGIYVYILKEKNKERIGSIAVLR